MRTSVSEAPLESLSTAYRSMAAGAGMSLQAIRSDRTKLRCGGP